MNAKIFMQKNATNLSRQSQPSWNSITFIVNVKLQNLFLKFAFLSFWRMLSK